MTSLANQHIAAMAPYAVADLSPQAGVPLISLAQNESLRLPSPLAIQAGREYLASSALYPDPDYPELRAAIAKQHNIDPDLVLVGAGSMELITCIAQAFAGPDRRVLSSQYGYALFGNAAQKVMAPYDVAQEQDLTVSVEALLEEVRSDTALVFVANPANPTGTRLPNRDLVRLRNKLPDDVTLVIDEAYGEFADIAANDQPLNHLVEQGNTVLVIEHNLEVIKTADWIIDMGPEGGDGGGTVVATGRPEDVAEIEASYTGRFLRELLQRRPQHASDAAE